MLWAGRAGENVVGEFNRATFFGCALLGMQLKYKACTLHQKVMQDRCKFGCMIGQTQTHHVSLCDPFVKKFVEGVSTIYASVIYRDGQKRWGCLLSYSQAQPGRDITQPSLRLLAKPCNYNSVSPTSCDHCHRPHSHAVHLITTDFSLYRQCPPIMN